jgi:drug/metabolite transporter (DMT)-like permease
MTAGAFVLGIVLATAAAAALAMSMVVQRYALASGESHVPLFGVPCRANVVWFLGLVGYGAANGLYVASLQYGPLALMASVFTLLLVFNCVFARCLLGEALTPPKVAGCVVILGGVCLVVVGSPKDVDVDLSASDVARLVAKPLGAAYLACLVGSVAASVAAIGAYERRYPLDAKDGAPSPPPRLDRLMGVVYPGSLGLDEAVAHLSMKAAVSLLGNGHWAAALTWIFSAAWIGASLATLWWLRTVFARYETTLALPIEYGSVCVANVLSGLVFYGERRFMSPLQLALVLAGVAVVLVGVGVGRIEHPPPSRVVQQQ